jgi:hypothetical protein
MGGRAPVELAVELADLEGGRAPVELAVELADLEGGRAGVRRGPAGVAPAAAPVPSAMERLTTGAGLVLAGAMGLAAAFEAFRRAQWDLGALGAVLLLEALAGYELRQLRDDAPAARSWLH